MAEVAQFCDITSASAEKAKFYLSLANNNVEAAIAAFFENDGGMAEDMPGLEEEGIVASSAPEAARPAQRSPPSRQTAPAQSAPPAKRPAPAKGNVRSLADMKSDDEGDDEEAPREYYTGGQKSGQMVQDPKRGGEDRVNSIFDRAREHGAENGLPDDLHQLSGGGGGGFSAFKGPGNKLSGSDAPTPTAEQPAAAAAAGPPPSVTHVITFWKNGFTVDNGPLRRMDDPANEPFISAISEGRCPRELEPPNRLTLVNINLVRKDENWSPPPEPKYVAFSGSGRTLAGPAGPAASAVAPATTSPAAPPPSSSAGASGSSAWAVDETKPSTKIQLRLADGLRVIGHFNLTHTVGDIRRFISIMRPGSSPSFTLQTQDRPPKVLADDSETIENAKLANAVIVQIP